MLIVIQGNQTKVQLELDKYYEDSSNVQVLGMSSSSVVMPGSAIKTITTVIVEVKGYFPPKNRV